MCLESMLKGPGQRAAQKQDRHAMRGHLARSSMHVCGEQVRQAAWHVAGTCRAAIGVGLLQDVGPEVLFAVGVGVQEEEETVQVLQAPAQRRSRYAPPARQDLPVTSCAMGAVTARSQMETYCHSRREGHPCDMLHDPSKHVGASPSEIVVPMDTGLLPQLQKCYNSRSKPNAGLR